MIVEPGRTRKDQLYLVAERLFSERGYHATTIREIARELQIEAGSLYSHISGKQELLYEIVRRASLQFLAAAQAVAAGGGPAGAQLRDLMRRHVAIVAESTDRAAVYFHEWRHMDATHQGLIKAHRDEYEASLRRIIRAGIAGGEFAPVDEQLVSLQVLSMLNWTYQWYAPEGRLSAEQLADRFYEQVMCGLEPRPEPPPSQEQRR